MNVDKVPTYWITLMSLAACALVFGLLVGCGSEIGLSDGTSSSTSGGGLIIGGVGTGGTGVIKSADTSNAVDSGLIGALVFLDKNGNRQPDPGEPSAVTDQNGSYSLQLDPAEAAAYPLLIMAVAGETINKATGQIITTGYVTELGAVVRGE